MRFHGGSGKLKAPVVDMVWPPYSPEPKRKNGRDRNNEIATRHHWDLVWRLLGRELQREFTSCISERT